MSSRWFMWKVKLVKALVSEAVLAKQARKPSGWLGKNILHPLFVTGNKNLNQFILELMALGPNSQVLEIGFGPGELLYQLCSQHPSCQFFGIDFSPLMIKEASLRNKLFIESDKLVLQKGYSDQLPFEDAVFHQVACANTLYFWQPPEPHLAEIFRVLKPGGKFVMGFRTGEQIDFMQLHPTIFARYSITQVQQILESVGFVNIRIESKAGFPVDSYCAVASKSKA